MDNFAAPLGPFCAEVQWILMLAPVPGRLLNLAEEDFGLALHLAYGQSITSLPLVKTIDYLNFRLFLDFNSITSNSAALF